jgi:hypothetical protein
VVTRTSKKPARSRLAGCIGAPGGITAQEALKRAANNVAFARKPSLRQLGDDLDKLLAFARSRCGQPFPAEAAELSRLALEAGDIAAAFGQPYTGQALSSLCELLDIYQAVDVWDERAYALHLSAIALLRDTSETEADEGSSAMELLHALRPEGLNAVAVVTGLQEVITYMRRRAGLN